MILFLLVSGGLVVVSCVIGRLSGISRRRVIISGKDQTYVNTIQEIRHLSNQCLNSLWCFGVVISWRNVIRCGRVGHLSCVGGR